MIFFFFYFAAIAFRSEHCGSVDVCLYYQNGTSQCGVDTRTECFHRRGDGFCYLTLLNLDGLTERGIEIRVCASEYLTGCEEQCGKRPV